MELLNNLVDKLGISNEQAKGGSSLIFNLVKENLDTDDFSKIASKIPGVSSLVSSEKKEEEKDESLMDKVGDLFGGSDEKEEEKDESLMDKVGDLFGGSDEKEEEKDESLMDKVGDMFGSSSSMLDSLGLEKLSTMAKLTSGFGKLGLDASTITKFLPVVMNFVKSKGGSAISDLVLKALK